MVKYYKIGFLRILVTNKLTKEGCRSGGSYTLGKC